MSTRSDADSSETLARFHAELDLVDLNARQVARRVASPSVTIDDLRSFGREGLLTAARSFDPSRGVPFRRWANLRIRGAMIDGVRQWGHLPRRVYQELRALAAADEYHRGWLEEEDAHSPATTPAAAEARIATYLAGMATAMAVGSLTGREALDDGPAPTPEDAVATAELIERVRKAVAELQDAKDRILLERHYFGDETLDEAATAAGVSKSWGSRVHARAIERVAKALRKI